MKIVKKKKVNYKGLGFVELIVSIGVAGIALMVLMNMAASSMREVIRYERHDALTRLAMDGGLIVRRHVENANDPTRTENITFGGNAGSCYKIDFGETLDDSRVDFTSGEYPKDALIERQELYRTIIYNYENNLGDVYYVAYCIERIDGEVYVGKVMTGYVDCSGCGIEPYEYSIIVNVRERIWEI